MNEFFIFFVPVLQKMNKAFFGKLVKDGYCWLFLCTLLGVWHFTKSKFCFYNKNKIHLFFGLCIFLIYHTNICEGLKVSPTYMDH